MKLTSTIAATLGVLALASTAHAQPITGVIGFNGIAVLNSPNLAVATTVTSWTGAKVGATHTGSFSSIATDTPALFTGGWVFGSGINPLWQVGGFTFNLSSSVIEGQNSNSLVVSGTGMITGNGFTPTPGTWRFSTQQPADGNKFEFSASSRAVPDGGTSVAMLGLSFLGLGGLSRLVRRK